MQKILVSACLLGVPVRYHGKDAKIESSFLDQWKQEGRIFSFCPEQQGGLPTPRPATEIIGGDGNTVLHKRAKVVDREQNDYTDAFLQGAYAALRLCQRHHIQIAILKSDSPSCGSHNIYDGSFTGSKKAGLGVTAALLRQNQIQVFHENEILTAALLLKSLENKNET